MELIDTPMIYSCACANIRRTNLVVTQFYDGMLAPSGLYAIQFGMLSIISKLGSVTLNHLAEIMDIDRPTLTRQLKILTDKDLVRYEEGKDQPSQVLLTQEGEQVLSGAVPLWQDAQEYIERAYGRDRFNAFLGELSTIRALLSSGVS